MNTAALPSTAARWAAARNFSWLMTDKLIGVLLGLFVFGLIARHYGAEASGQFAFGLALMQSALGLSLVCSAAAVLPRLVRQSHAVTGPIANIFVVRLGGSLIAALLTAAYAALTVDDHTRLTITLILLCSVPLLEPFYTAVAFWQSRNDNRLPTLVRASGLLTRTAVVLLAVTAGAPIEVIPLAWVLEAVASASLQMVGLRNVADLKRLASRLRAVRALRYFRYGVRFLPGLALSNLFGRIDRLVLAEHLPAHDFGLYAGAMQLVDVWVQIAYLLGFALGPAFLYRELVVRRQQPVSFLREVVLLALFGGLGLVGALVFGHLALRLVFGPGFVGAAPYLAAGMAFAVLMFIDQLVQLAVTSGNRPITLAFKWGCACTVAVVAQLMLLPALGAYAGPAGLAAGVLSGWTATALSLLLQRSTRAQRGRAPIAAALHGPGERS